MALAPGASASADNGDTHIDAPQLQLFVMGLFFIFGGITSLNDVIIPKLKELFTLNYTQAMLVQFCFFAAYAVIGIPGARLIKKIGYMRGAVAGLLTMMAGCLLFIPASQTATYGVFLLALFVLASGVAGTVDDAALAEALHTVLLDLTKAIARDGEGAETLIEVTVDNARDAEQAKTVAKSIVNSPLVKTAVHGADPNWGRVAMAVGKCSQYTDIDQEKVVIRFGTQEVYPTRVDELGLEQLSQYMRGDDVTIHVSLQTGSATATVWGCDLTDGYVRINADYTT